MKQEVGNRNGSLSPYIPAVLLLITLIAIPFGLVIADEQVGGDSLVGSLPCLLGGEFPKAGGTMREAGTPTDPWAYFPDLSKPAFLLRGVEDDVINSVEEIEYTGGIFTAGAPNDMGFAMAAGVKAYLDPQFMFDNDVAPYFYYPHTDPDLETTAVYIVSSEGDLLDQPCMVTGTAFALEYTTIYYYLNIMQWDYIEIGFVDAAGLVFKTQFSIAEMEGPQGFEYFLQIHMVEN